MLTRKKTADRMTAETDVLLDPEGDDPKDDPTVAEAIRLFQVDYSRLLHEHTRYYAVLAILTKRWTLRLPTMAVGLTRAGIHQLYINPTFYCRLDEAEHRMAILMHEVHHIVLGHCVATEWPQYVLNQPASFMIACELAANTHVSLALPNRPSRPILPAGYGLPDGLTTLEYFLQIRDDTTLQRRAWSAVGRIRRRNAGRLPEVVSGSSRSKCPAVTDLAVLRAAAEVGEDERGIASLLSRKRPRERPDEKPESLPEVLVTGGHAVPTDDWLAEHAITLHGDIRDGHVFARILNVLVEHVTRGYSLGGTFRSRTFKRPNRRQASAFGCPGVHKTGGGPALELDLCFLIDATSSMRPYIENVANSLWWMVNRLSRWRSINWRVGLTWYRDCHCDASFFCQHPFAQNVAQVKQQLESLRADGGGDEPESAAYGLFHTARRDGVTFDYPTVRTIDPWRPTAKRVIFLVTDASCHLKDLDVSFRAAVQAALRANIQIYVLGPWTWEPYQQICQATKGKLFRVES